MDTVKPNEAGIFNHARQIPGLEERRRYLEQACGEDEQLRARVEGLLRVHDEEASFLNSPTLALRTLVGAADGERPGTLIGPYKLLRQIGQGGMGTVFLAEQLRPIQRKVALKLVRPGLDSHQVIARFEAERQALALMDHPNI